jgi:flavin reductase (DIM6/NTAB) family NADH-FMN oxidoreductase RutF
MVMVNVPDTYVLGLSGRRGASATDAIEPPAGLSEAFKNSMASICAPLSVVTAEFDGKPHGTSVSAFASLSLDPPMVLVSLNNNSELLPVITKSGRFGLNVLASDQALLGNTFGRKGIDRFEGVDWTRLSGVPRLRGAAAWVACELDSVVDGGDHKIVLGRVIRAEHTEAAPLVYYKRQFGTYIPV